ncbi:CRISPR-associated family protein [Sphingomonas changbaiensis NBRC 104936]|uniref:CRISPR-associated endonuclease Cas9 n=1 Tax=Sphingomonas changbaiensis NBRC 104936 TaxID=1219043 RepID=A0A0E9MLX9_9SPHN|nr:type II CRISPR RNA-guided endonuclease Cas9 [Sphingomonas changbaiensis]GAO38406.1 CRISPR-associated family protein [Sphingomonas changbaiensis NBRC 104936]
MKRLGLDIGTNSIGWCLIEDDGDGKGRIIDIGARIFSDGRDPKSGASLAVDRRAARAMRRRRDRYLGRRTAFLKALKRFGLMPADESAAKLLADRDPYELRARALDERLEPHEIGRALFHLNQRRGFKSNRKAERKTKDAEDGKIANGAKALDQAMAESGAETLGQFLSSRDTKRVRMGSDAQGYDFYPQRRHVEYEFDTIWSRQQQHHPALLTEEARKKLHDILFFQRPLKEQEVGVCTFVHNECRLPKAHPLFQERRLYEEVNQLEITTPGAPNRKLTMDERDALILELRSRKERSFDSLAKRLKLAPGQSFNKASESRTRLRGDEVYAVMAHKKRFGDRWPHLDRDRQWAIIKRIIEEEDPDKLHAFLTGEWGLTDEQALATARAPLPELYGRLGPTATARILEELKKDVITYDEAVRRAGWHHSDDRTGEILPQLPYYGELLTRDIPPGTQDPNDPPEQRWGKITNPTVHIGLRQLEKLVNAIIKVHGRPDQIVVELARELKLNEKDKEEHNRRIRRDTAAAQLRSAKLQSEGIPDTGANRMLLRIWEELNPGEVLDRRCPYCGEPVGMRMLFAGEADIDHIIPYSRSLDDSAGNKVVAHRSCNRAKGNRTPYEKWVHDPDRWDVISTQVARLHKSKQWRFGPDAMARVEKDGGFIARQLTDTQYLSRLAGRYLSSLYPTKDDGSVYVIPGRMTAMLRRRWGLNSLLPDHNFVDNEHSNAPKNRLDHRHHAIDAAVVAVTTRALMQEIARTAGRAEDKDLDRLFEDLPQPWEGFREELGEKLVRVTVSHKPDHGRKGLPPKNRDVTAGRLHNDTAYGLTGDVAADGKTPIVVHRVPLMSLKPADISDPDRIPDPALRSALHRATDGLSGKAYDAALAGFAKTHPQFAGIRRVRVREPLTVIPIADRDGRPFKAYKGDANSRVDIWRMPDGKWLSDVVTMYEAHRRDHSDRRPHPAAKKLMSLRQNDMIAVERDGAPRQIMVVKQIWPTQINLVEHKETGNLKDRHSNETDPFRFFAPTAGGLKKMKARQVRIDPLGRIFDPGPR